MAKVRGKYASTGLAERRRRILSETLKLLEAKRPADISMALIADQSGVSAKTLYNLFKNRSGLLLAAAAFRRYETEQAEPVATAAPGIPQILELTHQTMETFQQSPEFMESAIAVVLGISAEEEAVHHRVGRTQEWFYEALLNARAEGQLDIGTDIMQLSQLMAASQWGVTLLWQKKLISLATLRQQTAIKHCLDLIPFCRGATKEWLQKLLSTLTNSRPNASNKGWGLDARMAS
jgi:AcrR family transcriptional regulator